MHTVIITAAVIATLTAGPPDKSGEVGTHKGFLHPERLAMRGDERGEPPTVPGARGAGTGAGVVDPPNPVPERAPNTFVLSALPPPPGLAAGGARVLPHRPLPPQTARH